MREDRLDIEGTDPGVTAPVAVQPGDDVIVAASRALIGCRSDCCSAPAQYSVLLPANSSRQHSGELLLCGHHTRLSRDALLAAGAAIYDSSGWLVSSPS